MLNKIRLWVIGILIYSIIEVLIVVACYLFLPKYLAYVFFTFLVGNGIIGGWILFNYQRDLSQRVLATSQVLGRDRAEALAIGGLGLVIYDEDYLITWTSEWFDEYQKEMISQKLLKVIPALKPLFNGETDETEIEFHDKTYRVIRKDKARVLFWHDITKIAKLDQEYQDNQVVIGMIHMDNYNDIVQNEDEQMIALINANLRQKIVEWAKQHRILIRRLRSDRFILVLNEQKYRVVEAEYFSLLDYIRTEAQNINVDITLSMVFARGTNDASVLDEMVNNLIELALSRGGDQVVTRRYQREAKFFGGASEAVEKSSKIKARVMARTIKELIEKSSNIFIVGHLEIDFDCLGAMLALSRIAQMYNNEVYVLSEGVDFDSQLEESFVRHWDTIADKHNFISEEKALKLTDDNTLVICVDHHHLGLCSAPELVNQIRKLIVIDHHRRSESFFIRPTLVYVEASASSSSELVIELLEYQSSAINLEPYETTLMLAGIIVDTNHFRVRSGTRTFEAASLLKAKGADSNEAESFLKDKFEDFEMKNIIYSYSEIIDDNILMAVVKDDHSFNRGLVAQAADELLDLKDIEVVFVIAKTENNACVISARSRGKINVQTILEKMDGGGHFSAAGLQRENSTVEKLEEELMNILKEDKNESNTAK